MELISYKNKIDVIFNQRFINIYCLIMIIFSAFTIYRRTFLQWVTPDQKVIDLVSNFDAMLTCIPFFLLPFSCIGIFLPNSRFIKWIDNKLQLKPIIGLALIGSLLCFIGIVFSLPQIFGSWPSDIVVITGFLIIFTNLNGRLPNFQNFIFSLAIMGIWMGIWELPYQIFLKLFYDSPQIGMSETYRWIQWEFIVELPMAGCSLCILALVNMKYKLLKFTKWFWIFLSLYVGFMVYWILDGYWVDTHYDWATGQIVQTEGFNRLHLFLSKASKVWFLLALISLIWKRDER